MSPNEETQCLLALANTPLLGSVKVRVLIEHCGSAKQAWHSDPQSFRDLPGFGDAVISAFTKAQNSGVWQQDLERVERLGAHLVPYSSPAYPKELLQLADHPVILYVLGTLSSQDSNSVAVVGTRNATIYGQEMALKLGYDFAALGFVVVSGLARGIDTKAHCGALEAKGRTLGIIGSGLANIYPKENSVLGEQIANSGALISEFPMNTPPDRQNFPQRNRLVAAMTRATLVVEAPEKSGAMLTVGRAKACHKPIFALPGRADMPCFRGNHALIKNGDATLIESAHDVAHALDGLFASQGVSLPKPKPSIALEPEEQKLLNAMPDTELQVEELIQQTQLPVAKLNVLLMSLVIKKVIKELPGKIYKKIA